MRSGVQRIVSIRVFPRAYVGKLSCSGCPHVQMSTSPVLLSKFRIPECCDCVVSLKSPPIKMECPCCFNFEMYSVRSSMNALRGCVAGRLSKMRANFC